MSQEHEVLKINKDGWNKVADQFFEGTFNTLGYGMYSPVEEELKLLGDLKGKVIPKIKRG
ncbi:hypothetical protein [Paenibacillus sp. 843]|uniref:hypothetical protein n=1 Tax=Paenibacillus sp. 843 TaxID=3341795 RepID=UPI0037279550